MKPEKLVLKGVYSYKDRVEIDFEKLASGGIFGIFGSVGSGKSSILEAITYSLYGEVERLNQKNRSYNLMNLSSNELYIEFIFSHNQERYKFNVSSKRSKKSFETVPTPDRKAYKWSKGDWIPINTKDVETILGIKYDYFKRIVIIPQGKFSDFIHLTGGDRIKMLKDLFPLEKFDLKQELKLLSIENKTELDRLQGSLKILEDITEEAKTKQKEDLFIEETKLKENEAKLAILNNQIKEIESIKALFNEKETFEKQFVELEKERAKFNNLEKIIQEFEKVKLNYSSLFDSISDLRKEEKDLNNKNNEKKQLLEEIEQNENRITSTQKEIIDQYGDAPQHKEAISQIDKAIDIIDLKSKLKEHENSINIIEKSINEKEETSKKRISELNEKKASLKELREKIKDESRLIELKNSYEKEDILRKKNDDAEKEVNTCKDNIETLKKKKNDLFVALKEKVPETVDWGELKADKLLEKIEAQIVIIKNSISELDKEKTHLTQLEGLSKYSATLVTGQPCPLCGSLKHPQPYSNYDYKDKLLSVNNAKKTEEQKKEALTNAAFGIKSLIEQFKQNKQSEELRMKELDSAKKELDKCKKDREFLNLDIQPGKVKDSLKEIGEIKKLINGFDKEVSKLEALVDDRIEIDKLKEKLQGIINERIAINASINEKGRDISKQWLMLDKKELKKEIDILSKSLNKLEQLTEELKRIETDKLLLSSDLKNYDERIIENREKLLKKQNEFNIKLSNDGYNSETQVFEILKHQLDVEKEKNRIEQFKHDLFNIKSKKAELEEKLKGKAFDENAYSGLKKDFAELNNAIDVQKMRIGGISQKLKTIIENLEEKNKTVKEFEWQDKRKNNLETISSLFRGDGFLEYVSQVYLSQLCSLANERYKKMTNNQLQLDINDDYEFIVRDFLNNGSVRLLKTLSGGQTFQAALCMALALSEQIQTFQQVKQQFFFLDEGFGSLDKESLSIVFDVLKQLRNENRTVGVISHLEEMKSEMDYYLLVARTDQEGSKITLCG